MALRKSDVEEFIRYRPHLVTRKIDEVSHDDSIRLWREVFEDVPLKRLSPRAAHRVSHGRHEARQNLSWLMKDLFQSMKKAGMSFADTQTLVADLDLYSRELYAADVTPACIRAASMAEILDDCSEDIAQHRLTEDLTKENASAYADIALRAIGRMQELVVKCRRYAGRAS